MTSLRRPFRRASNLLHDLARSSKKWSEWLTISIEASQSFIQSGVSGQSDKKRGFSCIVSGSLVV
jgi:hypothetical protein